MRDQRAREQDRPPFKVLGNGTLIEMAQRPPTSRRSLSGRKGITDLVVRRFGPDILAAVQRGLDGPEHKPIERKPQQPPRRRLDRGGEQRLQRLKRWRAEQASSLAMDPGVFCPNAGLEEIAWANPESADQILKLEHLKGWWVESFGAEVCRLLEQPRSSDGEGASPGRDGSSADPRTGRRRGHKRRGSPERGR